MNRLRNHKDHLSMEHIQAYLENRLSNQDRHLIERHLLDCGLCQEALDGYKAMGSSHDGLISDMQKAVDQSVLESKPSPWFNYRTYGIAAAMLILVISIYFIIDTQETRENQSITQNEKKHPETMAPDLAMNNAEEVIEEEIAPSDEMPTLAIEEPLEEPLVESETSVISGSETRDWVNSGPVDPGSDELIAESEDRITDEEGFSPEAGDSEGDDLFADELIAMDVIEEEIAPSAAPAMEPAAPSAAMRSRKAEASSGAEIRSSLDRQEPVPVDGFESYMERLYGNLQYPETALAASISGEVEVSFRVNQDGEPKEFNIKKSLSSDCDQEAIRLIKAGGIWLPAVNNGSPKESWTSLIIRFQLP